MKQYTKEQEREMILAINKKSLPGNLVIDLSFYSEVGKDFVADLGDLCTGRVSNQTVIENLSEYVRRIASMAIRDHRNLQKCTDFVCKNFPHAFFSVHDFMIGVENLTPEEINYCLTEADGTFIYLKNYDYEG